MPRRLGHEKPLVSARETMHIAAMQGGVRGGEKVECGERGCEVMPDCVSEASDLGQVLFPQGKALTVRKRRACVTS